MKLIMFIRVLKVHLNSIIFFLVIYSKFIYNGLLENSKQTTGNGAFKFLFFICSSFPSRFWLLFEFITVPPEPELTFPSVAGENKSLLSFARAFILIVVHYSTA